MPKFSTLRVRWFDFLVFSNTFIALCAVAQGWLTYMLLDKLPNLEVPALLYFATAFVYNAQPVLDTITKAGTSVSYRIAWLISPHRLIRILSFIAVGSVLVAGFFLQRS